MTDFAIGGLGFHILRDDLLNDGGVLGGNKARKMSIFMSLKSLPYRRLVSYGSAQSNAMAAMAKLAYMRNMQLVFFAARSAVCEGNLALARRFGARVIFASELDCSSEAKISLQLSAILKELNGSKRHLSDCGDFDFDGKERHLSNLGDFDFDGKERHLSNRGDFDESHQIERCLHTNQRHLSDCGDLSTKVQFLRAARALNHPASLAQLWHRLDDESFYIPEGAAIYEAKFGAYEQAKDLFNLARARKIDPNKCAVFLPSGTGTSALFLAQFAKPFRVFSAAAVCPKVIEQTANMLGIKNILELLSPLKRYKFAKPHAALLEALNIAQSASGVEFEPIYDALGFRALLDNLEQLKQSGIKEIIYIHQGGISGARTQLARYESL